METGSFQGRPLTAKDIKVHIQIPDYFMAHIRICGPCRLKLRELFQDLVDLHLTAAVKKLTDHFEELHHKKWGS